MRSSGDRSLDMLAGRSRRASLVFCLGSLQGFASGLDRVTRDLQLNSAPEASLVYDRNDNLDLFVRERGPDERPARSGFERDGLGGRSPRRIAIFTGTRAWTLVGARRGRPGSI